MTQMNFKFIVAVAEQLSFVSVFLGGVLFILQKLNTIQIQILNPVAKRKHF